MDLCVHDLRILERWLAETNWRDQVQLAEAREPRTSDPEEGCSWTGKSASNHRKRKDTAASRICDSAAERTLSAGLEPNVTDGSFALRSGTAP